MKKFILSIFCFCIFACSHAQTTQNLSFELEWEEGFRTSRSESVFAEKSIYFNGAFYNSKTLGLPIFQKRIKLNGASDVRAVLKNSNSESFAPGFESEMFDLLQEQIEIEVEIAKDRNEYYAFISLIPISKNGNAIQRLLSFDIQCTILPKFVSSPRTDQPMVSELSEGQLFKISVEEKGIYKIDANFVSESLGLDLNSINPKKIKLLATESGALRPKVSDARQADLLDYPLFFSGNDDTNFDQGEFFLFFTEGATRVELDQSINQLSTVQNPFSFDKHFFIKISAEDGARMGFIDDLGTGEFVVNNFDDVKRFEEDKFNILFQEDQAQGTGQAFYGDLYNQIRSQDFSFSFPNINSNKPAHIWSEMALRGATSSRFIMTANGNQTQSSAGASISIGNSERLFADQEKIQVELSNPTANIDVNISYPAVGDGTNKAWLDFIEVAANRQLKFTGDYMTFQNIESIQYSSATFNLEDASNAQVWDITDWDNPMIQNNSSSSSTRSWSTSVDGRLKKYIAVNPTGNFPAPNFVSEIENQNLHGIAKADVIILYHPEFKTQADRLAEHRANHNNLTIKTVDINHLWNEFSGGSVDPIGIRDFAKMLFTRDPAFKSLLLFGDGTFDYRNVYNAGLNFIPTFETVQSLHPIEGFPTDDYFGLLDDSEGASTNGMLDIAVGRIPCRNLTEATNVVNKIIHYDTAEETLGDWRNRMIFLADDEDGNLHFKDTEKLSDSVGSKYAEINRTKIYLDAFQQVSTSGGDRFPLANDEFNRSMFRGALVVNYLGHGGSQGWAQERVITQQDIGKWKNLDGLPLFITATCSFTGFDEPGLTSGGELTLLNARGGAIALMSTTRAVYAHQNYNMVNNLLDSLIYSNISVGEMLRIAKNKGGAGQNNLRKFGVFGDPSMHLKVPPLEIRTTTINGVPYIANSPTLDTLSALTKVTIEGEVLDQNGNVNSQFNGRIFPTIFDKVKIAQTLGQDEGSQVANFEIQNSVVFKGQATVENGRFNFSFIVPKDIDYNFGEGRISYYAHDGTQLDARGNSEGFQVGGGANADIGDDQPPLVEVFMNEIPFPNGGLTNENPTLIARLSDDFGINVAGQAVGHNLSAVLDGNTAESFLLNDFYEAELDDFTKGKVEFPLFDISPGKHTISVKAWDVSNNSGEGSIEFYVAESGEIALDHVLNYPNPFTTNTSFQFEHNMSDREMDVQVQIFSVSGKLVKTIQERVLPQGSLVRDIQWNGTDDYGQQLAKGVYVYRVKVRNAETPDSQTTVTSDYEKLVILK